MKYVYQTESMDALRLTFEQMLEEIDRLNEELGRADEANLELYDEANELEAALDRLRETYEQDMFDAAEDYLDLERSYNVLSDQYVDLYDHLLDEDSIGTIPFSR